MIGATPEYDASGAEFKPDNGLVGTHSYSVLHAVELSNGIRLLKIRNPWSSERFTGRWSDSSNLWTRKFVDEVGGHYSSDDGIFFIQLEDYFSNFVKTYINVDVTDWYSAKFLKLGDDSIEENPGKWSWCGSECTRHTLTLKSDVTQDVYLTAHTWEDHCEKGQCSFNKSRHSIYR